MPAWSGREDENARDIMCQNKTLFVVNSNRIGSLIIGGIDNHYSYETLYPKRKDPFNYQPYLDDSYPVILKVQVDESGYYFTQLNGTTRIQISTEDYFYGDRRDYPTLPGEILVSNNRTREALKSSWRVYRLYENVDSEYVKTTIDEIMQDPLTVSLNDIVSLDGEEDKEFILGFNKHNKDMIRRDLEIKKLNGQLELSKGYSRIEKNLADLPQKKKS